MPWVWGMREIRIYKIRKLRYQYSDYFTGYFADDYRIVLRAILRMVIVFTQVHVCIYVV